MVEALVKAIDQMMKYMVEAFAVLERHYNEWCELHTSHGNGD